LQYSIAFLAAIAIAIAIVLMAIANALIQMRKISMKSFDKLSFI